MQKARMKVRAWGDVGEGPGAEDDQMEEERTDGEPKEVFDEGARVFVETFLTLRMFHAVPLVWICNPDPLSIRIFNPQQQWRTSMMNLQLFVCGNVYNNSQSMLCQQPYTTPSNKRGTKEE